MLSELVELKVKRLNLVWVGRGNSKKAMAIGINRHQWIWRDFEMLRHRSLSASWIKLIESLFYARRHCSAQEVPHEAHDSTIPPKPKHEEWEFRNQRINQYHHSTTQRLFFCWTKLRKKRFLVELKVASHQKPTESLPVGSSIWIPAAILPKTISVDCLIAISFIFTAQVRSIW